MLAEFDGSGGLLRRYTYLPGMDHPHAVYNGSVWRYFASDGRGNVRALLQPQQGGGVLVEATYKYVPYGDTASTAGSATVNNIRFAGREFDPETGLYYNRARYYDPQLGRFVSEDAGSLAAGNRYTYAANDPVNGRDPSGRACEWVPGEVMAAAPPVATLSMSSGGPGSGVLICEEGGGELSWAAERAYWNRLFYDPLFINGGLGLTDFTPIGGGWWSGSPGTLSGSLSDPTIPVIVAVKQDDWRECEPWAIAFNAKEPLLGREGLWVLSKMGVIDYWVTPGGGRVRIPGGVGTYEGLWVSFDNNRAYPAHGRIVCRVGLGVFASNPVDVSP